LERSSWFWIIGGIAAIAAIIVTIKFKLYDRLGFWAFFFVSLGLLTIFVIFYLKPLEAKNKAMSNAAVVKRIKDIHDQLPGANKITWNSGINNKLAFRDFKRDNKHYRYWALLSKGADNRWFRNIYSEEDDNLIEIDGAMATEDMQDVFKGFKPFADDEAAWMKNMMMQGMMGRRRTSRRLKIPTPGKEDLNSDFYQNQDNEPGEVEK